MYIIILNYFLAEKKSFILRVKVILTYKIDLFMILYNHLLLRFYIKIYDSITYSKVFEYIHNAHLLIINTHEK